MADFDVVLRGGIVIDGTQAQRYQSDVGIRNGRIARIGRLRATDGRRILDAEGMIVAPGVIDLHTHYDAQLFWDPYLTLSGWHGVTSVVIGNCGFGFAPMQPELRERSMLTMTRVEAIPYEAMKRRLPWDWVSYPEFLDSVDRRPKALNVLPYWIDSCRTRGNRVYGQGVTTTSAFTFTFEDWNLFDDCAAWVEATLGTTAERKRKLADPTRRPALREYDSGIVTVAIADIVILDCFTPETKPFENLTIREVAEKTGKHPVDAMLDVAVADDLQTVFYAEPANVNRDSMREIIAYPWIIPGVSDGG